MKRQDIKNKKIYDELLYRISRRKLLKIAGMVAGITIGTGTLSGYLRSAAAVEWQPAGPNVALNKSYIYQCSPNNPPDDMTKLTNGIYGIYSDEIGWSNADFVPIMITIDLGQIEPICGVSVTCQEGMLHNGQHTWYQSIYIITSDDNASWFLTGDLVTLAETNPPYVGEGIHRYGTNNLATRGRYITIIIDPGDCYFAYCDEIQVYRAANNIDRPQGKQISPPLDYFWEGLRLEKDLDIINKRLQLAQLSSFDQEFVKMNLEVINLMMINPFPPLSGETPAILPLNDLQTRIFALNGIALKGQGIPPILVWKKNRFDPLGPIEQGTPNASLNISMMNNEMRSDAIILTNATEQTVTISLRITGLPGGINPDYINIFDIPFVDSEGREDVASAFLEPNREGKDYVITIPAGMNRQIWIMVHPTNIQKGMYNGKFVIINGSNQIKVPFGLRISTIRFPYKPRMHLNGWDYTNEENKLNVTPTNRDILVAYLKSRYIDTPWGDGYQLPMVNEGDFDVNGQLKNVLDFSNLDNWINRWQGARLFLTSMVGTSWANIDSPEFLPRVVSYIKAIAEHLIVINIDPNQFGINILDEPSNEDHARIISAWGDAIHQAGTGIFLWEDPIFDNPQFDYAQKALTNCDVISIQMAQFLTQSNEFQKAYLNLKTDKRKLWFYNTQGPTSALDPYSYYRLQHWFCFANDAEGSSFWSFSDAGGVSSWNERLLAENCRGGSHAPEYIDSNSVNDSKSMLGIIEGIQDYEYLCLLRDRINELDAKGIPLSYLADAKNLLQSAPSQILAGLEQPGSLDIYWKNPKDRSLADKICQQILITLENLEKF